MGSRLDRMDRKRLPIYISDFLSRMDCRVCIRVEGHYSLSWAVCASERIRMERRCLEKKLSIGWMSLLILQSKLLRTLHGKGRLRISFRYIEQSFRIAPSDEAINSGHLRTYTWLFIISFHIHLSLFFIQERHKTKVHKAYWTHSLDTSTNRPASRYIIIQFDHKL